VKAAAVDVRQYGPACEGSFEEYWKNPDCPAVYFGHYLSHNLFFRSVSAAFLGSSKEAIDAARKTRGYVERFVVNEPGLQRYMTGTFMMLVAHQQWDDIMKEKDIPEGCYAQKGYYFLPGKRDNFPVDTWILLYEPYEISAPEFLKAHFGGHCELKGCLRPETLSAIINCFRKSEDFSEHHESLLQ